MLKTINLTRSDIHKGALILVNPDHFVKFENIHLEAVNSKVNLEYNCAKMLKKAINECQCTQKVVAVSGYRSLQQQHNIWQDTLSQNGIEFTKKYVAIPGASEHQTGLAVDLGEKTEKIDFICPALPYDGIFKTLRSTLVQYGFIERYLESKENITRIAKEPWHFRYVGYPHSEIITNNKWVLEEYIDFIKKYSLVNPFIYGNAQKMFEIFFVPANKELTIVEMMNQDFFQVSGNNDDGFIITTWR